MGLLLLKMATYSQQSNTYNLSQLITSVFFLPSILHPDIKMSEKWSGNMRPFSKLSKSINALALTKKLLL